MAAAAQEPKAQYAPGPLRFLHGRLKIMLDPIEGCFKITRDPIEGRFKITRDPSVPIRSVLMIGGIKEAWNRPETESTHNSKGSDSLRASVIADYPGTQDPHGTGTGLAIACDNGGPYYAVNDHTLNRNDWFRAPLNGGSFGPKLCQFNLAAFDNLKRIEDLAAIDGATFTKERVKIGSPLWLASFKHSPAARVSEAANPGGATVRLDLDSGASKHAVGLRWFWIMRDMRPYSPPRWATLPDGSRLRIIGYGTIEINDYYRIPNADLVAGLEKNLISVSQLDRDHGLCCSFRRGHCTVTRPVEDVVGGAILEDDGLYQLRFLQVPQQ